MKIGVLSRRTRISTRMLRHTRRRGHSAPTVAQWLARLSRSRDALRAYLDGVPRIVG